jgi:hypothetical protein
MTAKYPNCRSPLLELSTVEHRESWRGQAKTTAFAIVVADVLGLLGLFVVILLVDYYEEAHGIESGNAAPGWLSVSKVRLPSASTLARDSSCAAAAICSRAEDAELGPDRVPGSGPASRANSVPSQRAASYALFARQRNSRFSTKLSPPSA